MDYYRYYKNCMKKKLEVGADKKFIDDESKC